MKKSLLYATCLLSAELCIYSGIQYFKPRPVLQEYKSKCESIRAAIDSLDVVRQNLVIKGFQEEKKAKGTLTNYTSWWLLQSKLQYNYEKDRGELSSQRRSLEAKLDKIGKSYEREKESKTTMFLLHLGSIAYVAYSLSALSNRPKHRELSKKDKPI